MTNTNQTTDWNEHKNFKATLDKDIAARQSQYTNRKLNNSNDRWKTVREVNNNLKSQPPRTLVTNTKVIYKLVDICNIVNTFYINVINEI